MNFNLAKNFGLFSIQITCVLFEKSESKNVIGFLFMLLRDLKQVTEDID